MDAGCLPSGWEIISTRARAERPRVSNPVTRFLRTLVTLVKARYAQFGFAGGMGWLEAADDGATTASLNRISSVPTLLDATS
jgi:hypothetical protein